MCSCGQYCALSLSHVPGVTDTWQDEMYDNQEGRAHFYGVPYIVSVPDGLADTLKCFPYCVGDQSIQIVTKVSAGGKASKLTDSDDFFLTS
jgi:hypothetical protein